MTSPAPSAILRDLYELGFSPLNCLLLIVIIGLITYIKVQIGSQNRIRESWHSDTRRQMTKLEVKVDALEKSREDDRKRIDECETDRSGLNLQIKALVEELEVFKTCAMRNCPFARRGRRRFT